MSVTILFILFGMYFIHTVKADADILPRVDELDQLLNWAIELSDNVLHCKHHSEGHIPLYYSCRSKNGNEDILHLVDGYTSSLLYLLEIEALNIDLE